MNAIISTFSILFWFVVILVPLVIIHEFGHFIMSRLNGVRIPEFGVGFPLTKRLFYKRWKGVIWSFYPLLIGGFVRIWGDSDAIDEAYDEIKKDKQKTAEDYIQNRFQEILANRDLKFFLEDNNLEYTSDWKEFENSKFVKGKDADEEKDKVSDFEDKYKQISTLITWELEKELKAKDTFFNKNWLQQTLIISGGVIFNFLAAIGLFWILFSLVNPPQLPLVLQTIEQYKEYVDITNQSNTKVASVTKDYPAYEIGIRPQDEIISFAGVEMNTINSQNEFRNLVLNNRDTEITVVYFSNESKETVSKQTIINEKEGKYLFGVGNLYREVDYQPKGIIPGFQLAINRTFYITNVSFGALGEIILALNPFAEDRSALNYVAGPIAVGSISTTIFKQAGIAGILELMALVSISLAVFNMLPIPALDGGRWIILTINKITGKRNRKIEATVISVTFVILLLLATIIAINDTRGAITGRFR